MWVSRSDEVEKVRDTVQVNNPLTMNNNFQGMRSPLSANFHAARRISPIQNAAADAGVVVSISGGNRNNSAQNNVMSLSNIDVNLFAAD